MKSMLAVLPLLASCLIAFAGTARAAEIVSAADAFSVAGPNDPLPADRAKAVRQAIVDAFAPLDVSCTSSTDSFSTEEAEKQALIDFVKPATTGVRVYLTADGTQPVITLKWNDADTETTCLVTTSADYKSVVTLSAKREAIRKKTVNAGTIIEPRYETREVRTTFLEATCSAR